MNDQTPQTPATPDGAASVLTVGLGVLRPHELEVYDELIGLYFYEQTNGSKKLWWSRWTWAATTEATTAERWRSW